ncbi:MAG: YicC/YloC family endoribonuclease [Brumimicrobium sp.]|nr:YicC/YloC family endoribonuclease [Brumimicrobium sp.]
MLQSMTGFGKATLSLNDKKITVEIRSLNSKGLDVYLKIPNAYKEYEPSIRKLIGDKLIRGKIECTITEENGSQKSPVTLNTTLIKKYHEELKNLSAKLGEHNNDLMSIIMRFPEVLQSQENTVSEDDWLKLEKTVLHAIVEMTEFRKQEGHSLTLDLQNSLDQINNLLQEVPKYEELRIDTIRERMRKGLEKLDESVDENRFEQELIYYIEKLDISEEKVRLQHHLDYFRENLISTDAIGKKLGFITQEIGREINTLGSKSYHADLQKIVVEMKDYLEKIKEQVLNAL